MKVYRLNLRHRGLLYRFINGDPVMLSEPGDHDLIVLLRNLKFKAVDINGFLKFEK